VAEHLVTEADLHQCEISGKDSKAFYQAAIETFDPISLVNEYLEKNTADDSFKALMFMAKIGLPHVDFIKRAIAQGAGVNQKDGDGRTALHLAAMKGNHSVVSLLLYKGADAMRKDNEQQTALMKAASSGNVDVVRRLLGIRSVKQAINSRDAKDNTALHLAAKKGHSAVVDLLCNVPDMEIGVKEEVLKAIVGLKSGVAGVADAKEKEEEKEEENKIAEIIRDSIKVQEELQRMPVLNRVGAGQKKDLDEQKKEEEKSPQSPEDLKRSAAHSALMDPIASMISGESKTPAKKAQTAEEKVQEGKDKALITKVLDEAAVASQDDKGEALILAAKYGDLEAVKTLLKEEADIDALDDQSATALLTAARKGHAKVVDHLIEAGADIDLCDISGCTTLIWEVFNGHVGGVSKLLSEKADVAMINMRGETAWSLALKRGEKDIVRSFLDAKNVNDAKNVLDVNIRCDAVTIAFAHNRFDVLEVLVDWYKANTNMATADKKQNQNLQGDLELAKHLLAKREEAQRELVDDKQQRKVNAEVRRILGKELKKEKTALKEKTNAELFAAYDKDGATEVLVGKVDGVVEGILSRNNDKKATASKVALNTQQFVCLERGRGQKLFSEFLQAYSYSGRSWRWEDTHTFEPKSIAEFPLLMPQTEYTKAIVAEVMQEGKGLWLEGNEAFYSALHRRKEYSVTAAQADIAAIVADLGRDDISDNEKQIDERRLLLVIGKCYAVGVQNELNLAGVAAAEFTDPILKALFDEQVKLKDIKAKAEGQNLVSYVVDSLAHGKRLSDSHKPQQMFERGHKDSKTFWDEVYKHVVSQKRGVRALRDSKESQEVKQGKNGATALMLAVQRQDEEGIENFLRYATFADIGTRDSNNFTAMDIALVGKNLHVLQRLRGLYEAYPDLAEQETNWNMVKELCEEVSKCESSSNSAKLQKRSTKEKFQHQLNHEKEKLRKHLDTKLWAELQSGYNPSDILSKSSQKSEYKKFAKRDKVSLGDIATLSVGSADTPLFTEFLAAVDFQQDKTGKVTTPIISQRKKFPLLSQNTEAIQAIVEEVLTEVEESKKKGGAQGLGGALNRRKGKLAAEQKKQLFEIARTGDLEGKLDAMLQGLLIGINVKADSGLTALMVAANNGQEGVVNSLLNVGADVTIVTTNTTEVLTALDFARLGLWNKQQKKGGDTNDNLKVLKALLGREDIKVSNKQLYEVEKVLDVEKGLGKDISEIKSSIERIREVNEKIKGDARGGAALKSKTPPSAPTTQPPALPQSQRGATLTSRSQKRPPISLPPPPRPTNVPSNLFGQYEPPKDHKKVPAHQTGEEPGVDTKVDTEDPEVGTDGQIESTPLTPEEAKVRNEKLSYIAIPTVISTVALSFLGLFGAISVLFIGVFIPILLLGGVAAMKHVSDNAQTEHDAVRAAEQETELPEVGEERNPEHLINRENGGRSIGASDPV
jgi:ankyrin repeat protein